MSSTPPPWKTRLLDLAIVAAIAFVAFGPNGIGRAKWIEWRAQVRAREVIQRHWAALAGEGSLDQDVVVEYMDYQCPACRAFEKDLAEAAVSGRFVVVRRNYPISSIHPLAEGAALAAICAQRQGRFQAMDSTLMHSEAWMQEGGAWASVARDAGVVDLDGFEACMVSEETGAQLAKELALGDSIGVSGTPTFLTRRGVYTGLPSPEKFSELLGR